MALISNKDNTQFAARVLPNSPSGASIKGPRGRVVGGSNDFKPLGTGKFLSVEASNDGTYEIVATASGYPSKTQTLTPDPALPTRVQFTFTERSAGRQGLGFGKAMTRYEPGYRHRYAAVIGINDYVEWRDLAGARSDAERIAGKLRSLGFDEVIELYDRSATREAILNLVGEVLPSKVEDNDLAIIFYAGHGQTETLPHGEKRGYMVPADALVDRPFSSAISMETLRDLRVRTRAKHMLYLMDSCYSGLMLSRGVVEPEGSGDKYAEIATTYPAAQMLTAGEDGQVALEVGGVGLFTKFVLRALDGEADVDGDGIVSAFEMSSFVVGPVTRASNGAQTPQFGWMDAGSGNVIFDLRQ